MMSCAVEIIDGVARISGELSFATANKIANAYADISKQCETVDLQSLNFIDSAGLALLVCWKNQAENAARNLRFIHYPQSLEDLANLADLTHILE